MAGEVEAAHVGHMAHEHPGSPWGRLSPHPATSETEGGRKGNPDARGLGSQASDRHGAHPVPRGSHRESRCVSAGCVATPSCFHCKPTDTPGVSVDVSPVVHICLLQELGHTWERGSEGLGGPPRLTSTGGAGEGRCLVGQRTESTSSRRPHDLALPSCPSTVSRQARGKRLGWH